VIEQATREYILRSHSPPENRPRIVPCRPSPRNNGSRNCIPYASADLNALYATAKSATFRSLVTINPPPVERVDSSKVLERIVKWLKATLKNLRSRHALPPYLVVTEFDPHDDIGLATHANFHIGFTEPLSSEQSNILRRLWLGFWGASSNQGCCYDYRAGTQDRLGDYLLKDAHFRESPLSSKVWSLLPENRPPIWFLTRKGNLARFCKFQPEWLPRDFRFRLWWVSGIKRLSAAEGAKARRNLLCPGDRRMIRRRYKPV